jgi:glutathione S-transferase
MPAVHEARRRGRDPDLLRENRGSVAGGKGVIELYQFPRAFGLPNPSPFCMKVETWLRLAGLPYEVKDADPRKAPLGKLPYIRDGEKVVADSTAILDYLAGRYGADLDAGLSDAERAQAHAHVRMLEEHTYFALVYSRWVDERTWPQVRAAFFGFMPPVLNKLVPAMVQKQLRRDLRGHGLGRHDAPEIYARAGKDFDAVAAFLGSKLFFMGDRPTRADATVYAFVGNAWESTLKGPMAELVGRHRNLVDYCARMKQKCFA